MLPIKRDDPPAKSVLFWRLLPDGMRWFGSFGRATEIEGGATVQCNVGKIRSRESRFWIPESGFQIWISDSRI